MAEGVKYIGALEVIPSDDCEDFKIRFCGINSPDDFIEGDLNAETLDVLEDLCKIVYTCDLEFCSRFILSKLKDLGYSQTYFREDVNRARTHEFEILRNTNGQFYRIVIFDDKAGKHRTLEIRDIFKKLLMSYEDFKNFSEESTLSKISAFATEFHTQGLDKLTVGSDAISFFRKRIGSKEFKKLFPRLSLTTENFVRQAYSGGIVFCNRRFEGKDLDETVSLDVNSMYPDKMRNYLMPYGVPEYFEGAYEEDDEYPIYIQKVCISGRAKPDKFPFLRSKSLFNCLTGEVMYELEDFTCTLTCEEISLLFESYNIDDIYYIEGYKFKARSDIFVDYVDYWMNKKKQDTGARREIDKLMLNNLGGKFATKPVTETTELDETATGEIKYVTVKMDDVARDAYLPVSVFMNSYARCHLTSMINQCYDRVIYCDTDSIHLLGKDIPDCFQISDTELGKFKIEGISKRARYLGPKKYIREVIRQDGETEIQVKASGLSGSGTRSISFDEFKKGHEVTGNLRLQPTKRGARRIETNYIL